MVDADADRYACGSQRPQIGRIERKAQVAHRAVGATRAASSEEFCLSLLEMDRMGKDPTGIEDPETVEMLDGPDAEGVTGPVPELARVVEVQCGEPATCAMHRDHELVAGSREREGLRLDLDEVVLQRGPQATHFQRDFVGVELTIAGVSSVRSRNATWSTTRSPDSSAARTLPSIRSLSFHVAWESVVVVTPDRINCTAASSAAARAERPSINAWRAASAPLRRVPIPMPPSSVSASVIVPAK